MAADLGLRMRRGPGESTPGLRAETVKNHTTMQIMKNRIIRSKMVATSGLALLLGALALFSTAGHHPGSPRLSDQLFAQRIAGGYLMDMPGGTRMLANLNLGGAVHRESSFDFIGLSGLPGLPFHFHGGGFGNWARTGPRTIRVVELSMLYRPDGFVDFMERVRVDFEFDTDFESATGAWMAEFFHPEQDPLTEEPAFVFSSGEGLVLRRIQ